MKCSRHRGGWTSQQHTASLKGLVLSVGALGCQCVGICSSAHLQTGLWQQHHCCTATVCCVRRRPQARSSAAFIAAQPSHPSAQPALPVACATQQQQHRTCHVSFRVCPPARRAAAFIAAQLKHPLLVLPCFLLHVLPPLPFALRCGVSQPPGCFWAPSV